jgi:hypothetical protein
VTGTGERAAHFAAFERENVVTGLGEPAGRPRPRRPDTDDDEVVHSTGYCGPVGK